MTLKEKFKNLEDEINIWGTYYDKKVQIADDYAIEFAEWVCNNLYDFPKTEQKYLLEIFKKEKGL